jgi:hypothetical protein
MPTSHGFKCAQRDRRGTLDAVSAEACPQESIQQPLERWEQDYVGPMLQFRLQQRKENESHMVSAHMNSKRKRGAASIIARGLPNSPPVSSNPPAWHRPVHSSHDLGAANGYAFCRKCGSLPASHNLSSMLFQQCEFGLQGEGCVFPPPGSKWRLGRIMKGLHPEPRALFWPDGKEASEVASIVYFEHANRDASAPGNAVNNEVCAAANSSNSRPNEVVSSLSDDEFFAYIDRPKTPEVSIMVEPSIQRAVNEVVSSLASRLVATEAMLSMRDFSMLVSEHGTSQVSKALEIFFQHHFEAWNELLDEAGLERREPGLTSDFQTEVVAALKNN